MMTSREGGAGEGGKSINTCREKAKKKEGSSQLLHGKGGEEVGGAMAEGSEEAVFFGFSSIILGGGRKGGYVWTKYCVKRFFAKKERGKKRKQRKEKQCQFLLRPGLAGFHPGKGKKRGKKGGEAE